MNTEICQTCSGTSRLIDSSTGEDVGKCPDCKDGTIIADYEAEALERKADKQNER